MLKIVSAGAAFPAQHISTQLLLELQPALGSNPALKSCGVELRPTILDLTYLRETKNVDVWQSKQHLAQSANEIAVQAAQLCLERARIKPEEIGLIIGETGTPFETTPSEAQRVGKALGIKIPAYDVAAGSSSLIHYLALIDSWKEESRANYTLCVSTHTPTQRINYSQGVEGAYFGDASCAMLLSSRHDGGLGLRDVHFEMEYLDYDPICFPTYGSGCLDPSAARVLGDRMQRMLKQALTKHALDPRRLRFIGNQIDLSLLKQAAEANGIAPSNLLTNLEQRGFSLCASSLGVLSDKWNDFARGDLLLVAEAGASFGMGYAVLERL